MKDATCNGCGLVLRDELGPLVLSACPNCWEPYTADQRIAAAERLHEREATRGPELRGVFVRVPPSAVRTVRKKRPA